MFDAGNGLGSGSGQLVDELPQVLAATIRVLHRDYGIELDKLVANAVTLVLYTDWIMSGVPLARFAETHGLSEATFKRMMNALLGERRKEFTRNAVRSRLETAILRRLQVSPNGLSLFELRDHLEGTNELTAARNHKVPLERTLRRMERSQPPLVRCSESEIYSSIGEYYDATPVTPQRKLEENAVTAGMFLEGARVYEETIKGICRQDISADVSRVEGYIATGDRCAYYSDLVAAIVEVTMKYEKRAKESRAPVHAVHVPFAVVHRLQLRKDKP
jgi:hypothetical protein